MDLNTNCQLMNWKCSNSSDIYTDSGQTFYFSESPGSFFPHSNQKGYTKRCEDFAIICQNGANTVSTLTSKVNQMDYMLRTRGQVQFQSPAETELVLRRINDRDIHGNLLPTLEDGQTIDFGSIVSCDAKAVVIYWRAYG